MIDWAIVNADVCCHMASQGHNELLLVMYTYNLQSYFIGISAII